MKRNSQKKNILNAKDKFSQIRESLSAPADLSEAKPDQLDLTQLGELAIKLLNDKNLEVSKVRPFFWSLVEAYVDRFQLYPFDVSKVLFSHLELNDYPEKTVKKLVEKLESQFEQSHGRPLRKLSHLLSQQKVLDDEIQELRDSIKYAAMVAEGDE